MKKILPIYLILFFAFHAVAQPSLNQISDSLKTDLAHYQKRDSVRCEKLINLGASLIHTNIKEAITFTDQGMQLSKAVRWERGVVSAIRQQGAIYFELGEFDKAIEFQLMALKAITEFKGISEGRRKLGLAVVYNNLALNYTRLKKFDKSIASSKKALAYAKQASDNETIATVYYNLSTSYLDAGQLAEAELNLEKCYEEALKISYFRIYPFYFCNKGLIRTQQKKYVEAIAYLKKGLEYAQQINDVICITDATILLGEAYYFNADYPTAVTYLQKGLDMAKAIGSGSRKYESMGILAETYGKLKQYNLAFETHKKYAVLRDSVIGMEKKEEIARKETQFEADKKQAITNAEVQRQKIIRYGTMGSSGVVLLSGIFLFVGYRKRRNSREIQQELLLQNKISDIRMQVRRLQMNPHFIFNSLNSISDYIGKSDIKTADYFLVKFAKLMRGILENSEEEEITLEDELRTLELYMQLEALRLNHTFAYEIKIDDDINPETTFVPPLILQPFVENSIWHGMKDKDSHGKIIIEVTKNNNMLSCIVEDDGVGRTQPGKSDKKPHGMEITRDRIALLNKLKNTQASINIIDLEKGTRVEVILPLTEDEL